METQAQDGKLETTNLDTLLKNILRSHVFQNSITVLF